MVFAMRKTGTLYFSGTPPMSATSPTILVVEDDAIVRMLIVDVLEELGFKVVEAADAEDALTFVKTGEMIDLMMTDVGLPDMDGKQLAAKVRALRPALPILFASGYAEALEVEEGMHVIGKPFSIDQLRDKINAVLAAR